MSRRLFLPLAVGFLGLVGALADIRILATYWPGSFFDSITSSVWTALAWDAAHGELYRPVFDGRGYGGTRYMPVFTLLYALLIRAHADVVYAGVALMQASVLGAAVALFCALRAFDVPRTLAAPLAGTVWSTLVYQKYATDTRGDYLAAALAMTAIALAAKGHRRRRSAAGSGTVAVLATFTKMTAAAVALPVAATLFRRGRRGVAARFVAVFALGVAAAALIVEAASHGRFLENLRATATGGASWRDVLRAPWTLLDELIREPFVAVPVALAAWTTLRARHTWTLAHAYFVTTCAATAAIFASPGTASNHLVDLQMAAALVVAVGVTRGDLSADAAAVAYAGLALVLAAVSWPVPGIPSVIGDLRAHGPRARSTVRQLHEDYVRADHRYLSEDAIVPILNGERPLVLDAFSLRNFVARGTEAGRDVARRVEAHEFEPIILRENFGLDADLAPGDPALAAFGVAYWSRKHDEIDRLFQAAYEIVEIRRPFVVLMPRATPTSRSSPR